MLNELINTFKILLEESVLLLINYQLVFKQSESDDNGFRLCAKTSSQKFQ